jgi:hypothetical protein
MEQEKETLHTSSDLPGDGESNVGEGEERREIREQIKKLREEIQDMKKNKVGFYQKKVRLFCMHYMYQCLYKIQSYITTFIIHNYM